MAEDKLGIEFGIKMDTRKFQQEISSVTNLVKRLSVEMSTLGAKARKSMEKYATSLQNMVNIGSGGTPDAKRNKDGSFNKNSLKKAYSSYSKRAIKVYANELQTMGTLVAKLNVALEPMVTNMALAQEIANKTNSAYMQSVNYQSQLNKKVENRLLSKKNELEAQLKNASLIKDAKELQEKISDATKTNKVLEKEATKEKEKQEKLDRQKAKEQEKAEKAKQKELEKQEKLNQKTEKQVSLVTQLRRMFTSLYVIKRFANIFRDMTKESGAWIENLNLFAVSFGEDFYRESLDWATEFSEKLGVSANEIIKLTANFRQLTSAIGYSQELSDELSKTLTSLSYDLTSYYNLESADTAYTKLSSGIFSGQVKTLRSLGIDVSAESVTTHLKELSGTYSEFIGITNAGLDQSQKVLARTLLVMKSATNSFGDMARSIETLANRERIFQASIQNLKLALGDLMSDGLSNLLAYLNGTIRAITTIIRVFKPLKEELPYEIGGTVLGQVSEEAEEAEKNVSKLSFDKFETLTGGSDSKGQLGITEALTAELQKQIELYNKQASQFDGIDEVAQGVYNSLLKWAFPLSEINEETGEITLNTEKYGDGLQSIVNLSNTLTNIWNTFEPIIPALIEVSGTILDIVSNVVTLLDKLGLLEEVIYAIIAMDLLFKLSSIVTAVTTLIPLIASLGSIIMTAFANPATWLFVLVGLLIAFGDQVKWFFQQILQGLAVLFFGTISILVNGVVSIINVVIMAINGVLKGANAIASIFGGKVDTIPLMQGITLDMFMGMIPQFYNGGSLDMGTQIWGMNEKGNPEFMFNAGGYDSVINADILEKAIARGTESAIISSGLLDKAGQELVIRGDRIDNDAFARAIFPAIQKENVRLGGKRL